LGGGYRGDEERAGVLDPMGGGALRSPHAAIGGLAPSAAHEGWGQETRATSPQLLTSRAYQRNLGDLRGHTQKISHFNYIYSFSSNFSEETLLTYFLCCSHTLFTTSLSLKSPVCLLSIP